MLTWLEADLFLRSGEDMRFDGWPEGVFLRATDGIPKDIEGYSKETWTPTQLELTQPKWRKA